jgi:hypothetical protein
LWCTTFAAKVYGVITFILEHPLEVEAYLQGQDRIYEQIQPENPMLQDMIERFNGLRER